MSNEAVSPQSTVQTSNQPSEATPKEARTNPNADQQQPVQHKLELSPSGTVLLNGDDTGLTPDELKNNKEFKRGLYKKVEESTVSLKKMQEDLAKTQAKLKQVESDPLADPELGVQLRERIYREILEMDAERERLSQMTPEQIELEDTKKKLSKYEQEKQEREQAEARQKEEQEESEFIGQVKNAYETLVQQEALADHPMTRDLLARHHVAALASKKEGYTPKMLAESVKEESNEFAIKVVSGLKGEALLQFLDPVLKEVNQALLERYKTAGKTKRTAPKQSTKDASEKREESPVFGNTQGWGLAKFQ